MMTRLCLALFSAFSVFATVASQTEARQTYGGSGYKTSSLKSISGKRSSIKRSSAKRSSIRRSSTKRRGGSTASRTCLTSSARALLGRIESQFGSVKIVSTCRPGARIRGTGKQSKHATGQAIDFLAPSGRKGEVVRWLMANHRSGGIMTYPGMNHIHVDIGYRFVSLAGRRLRSRG
jgi:hypothetical protein